MKLIFSLTLWLFIFKINKSIVLTETTTVPSDAKVKRDVYIQHSMHRIKDPELSLRFYTEALGLTLLHSEIMALDKFTFTMYFLAYEDTDNIPNDVKERIPWSMSHPGAVNLQHVSSGSNDSNYDYHDGNALPTGHSHIGIFATDVYAFCDRLVEFNVTFIKKPDEGIVKGNAFILDPDGYWIEIMNPYKMGLTD